jgi:6-phosphogluconolactonase
LGVDRVLQYRLDAHAGELQPIDEGFVSVPDNTGPRHMAFSQNGELMFVLGEMSGTVTTFAIDAQSGALSQRSVANGIPEHLGLREGLVRDNRNNNLSDDPTPRIWCADIRLVPDGKLLYITERTTSTVSVFQVSGDGTLNYLGNYPLEEKQPRNIAISPNGRWLLACGELSDTVSSYRIHQDGMLERIGQAPSGQGALWIEVRA